jgi:hypothetical protein
MSNPPTFPRSARYLAALGVAISCLVGCGKPAKPTMAAKAAAPAANTNAPVSTNDQALAYVSVFEDLPPPKGRDPFFPKSHRRELAAPPGSSTNSIVAPKPVPVVPVLVLKGVVGSATRRLALINNQTMAPGETSSVRVPDGRVRVKCLEIGTDYVVVKVEGEDEPKRLEMGKQNP